jgi:hypothetical protein
MAQWFGEANLATVAPTMANVRSPPLWRPSWLLAGVPRSEENRTSTTRYALWREREQTPHEKRRRVDPFGLTRRLRRRCPSSTRRPSTVANLISLA